MSGGRFSRTEDFMGLIRDYHEVIFKRDDHGTIRMIIQEKASKKEISNNPVKSLKAARNIKDLFSRHDIYVTFHINDDGG